MRRVWAAVVSVWALVAIVGVLAWTRQPSAAPLAQASPTVVIVKGANGTARRVVLPAAAVAHATTQTSPGAGGAATAPVVLSGTAGSPTVLQSAPASTTHATTRTS
jgi:hypothetical protein